MRRTIIDFIDGGKGTGNKTAKKVTILETTGRKLTMGSDKIILTVSTNREKLIRKLVRSRKKVKNLPTLKNRGKIQNLARN